jgi:hypothetical protein
MIANIALDDALILPHRANPTGLNFRERHVDACPLLPTVRVRKRIQHCLVLLAPGGGEVRVRSIGAIVQGIWIFILDHFALLNPLREPRTVLIFELGLVCRARPGAPFPKATLTSDGRSHDGRGAAIRFVQTRRP